MTIHIHGLSVSFVLKEFLEILTACDFCLITGVGGCVCYYKTDTRYLLLVNILILVVCKMGVLEFWVRLINIMSIDMT